MRVGLTFGGVLAVAGVGLAGAIAFVAWRRGGSVLSAAGDVIEQGAANVRSAVVNSVTRAEGGDPVRAALYSDRGYTGRDDAGAMPADGDWLSTEEGRRYTYEEARRARERGEAPPVSSNNGAAFGVYPRAGRRPAQGYGQEVGAMPSDDDNMQEQARMLARWRAGNPREASGRLRDIGM